MCPSDGTWRRWVWIGSIPIVAIHSRLRRVAHRVGVNRVGQVTDYDKLVRRPEADAPSKREGRNPHGKALRPSSMMS